MNNFLNSTHDVKRSRLVACAERIMCSLSLHSLSAYLIRVETIPAMEMLINLQPVLSVLQVAVVGTRTTLEMIVYG